MKDTIKIITSQLAVLISKQIVLTLASILISEQFFDVVNKLSRKSESYLLNSLINENEDQKVKDINTTPRIARINFIITYFIVSKIIISTLKKIITYKHQFFIKNSSSLIFL